MAYAEFSQDYSHIARLEYLRNLCADYKIVCDNTPCVISEKLKYFSLLCIVCRINSLLPLLLENPSLLTEKDRSDIFAIERKIKSVKLWYKVRTNDELMQVMLRSHNELFGFDKAVDVNDKNAITVDKIAVPTNRTSVVGGKITAVNNKTATVADKVFALDGKNKLNASAEEFIPSGKRSNYKDKLSMSC